MFTLGIVVCFAVCWLICCCCLVWFVCVFIYLFTYGISRSVILSFSYYFVLLCLDICLNYFVFKNI